MEKILLKHKTKSYSNKYILAFFHLVQKVDRFQLDPKNSKKTPKAKNEIENKKMTKKNNKRSMASNILSNRLQFIFTCTTRLGHDLS